MAWIESHQEIREHPKTVRLKRRLGASLPATIGHLHLFWWWALSYAEDGDLSRFEDEIISDACGWEGEASEFVAAMIAAGFVNEDRTVHDWDTYTGRIRKQRADNRVRQQRWRDSHAGVTRSDRDTAARNALVTRESPLDNPATGPNQTLTGPDHTPPVVPPAAAGGDSAADAAPPKPEETSKTVRSKRKPPATPAPETFDLTPEHLDYAAEYGLDSKAARAETEKFLAHHRFKGTLGSDWYAGWQNWIRNAVGRFADAATRSPPNGRASPPKPDDHLTSTAHRVKVQRF